VSRYQSPGFEGPCFSPAALMGLFMNLSMKKAGKYSFVQQAPEMSNSLPELQAFIGF
jgi:hypothetical protein